MYVGQFGSRIVSGNDTVAASISTTIGKGVPDSSKSAKTDCFMCNAIPANTGVGDCIHSANMSGRTGMYVCGNCRGYIMPNRICRIFQ